MIPLESASTVEATATEATATATATTTRATETTATATTTTTATEEAILANSEEVQTIDDMQHGVVGNGIVLGIAALHGRDDTANS